MKSRGLDLLILLTEPHILLLGSSLSQAASMSIYTQLVAEHTESLVVSLLGTVLPVLFTVVCTDDVAVGPIMTGLSSQLLLRYYLLTFHLKIIGINGQI